MQQLEERQVNRQVGNETSIKGQVGIRQTGNETGSQLERLDK
jgi:hypothetical protein